MIETFEQITKPLTEEEKRLVEVLVRGFRNRTKDNPIKAPEVVRFINQDYAKYGLTKKLSEPRLRKLVNHIRSHGLLPLIATSSGYYCSTDLSDVGSQINSLKQRADAMLHAAKGLEDYKLKFLTEETLFGN